MGARHPPPERAVAETADACAGQGAGRDRVGA
jgi:hypothetical protein